MSLIEGQGQLPVVKKRASVRVKLERIDCNVSRSLPSEGDHHVWMERLKAALGTASIEFVDATLYQLQAAARLPNSGVSEIAVNAALAMIESEQPRGETECAIVIQMACLHSATMAVLGRLGGVMVATVTLWRRQRRQAGYLAVLRFWSRRCAGCGAADRRSFALSELKSRKAVRP
jgi:hypothetical protein